MSQGKVATLPRTWHREVPPGPKRVPHSTRKLGNSANNGSRTLALLNAPSRGVQLLRKAKDFHVAAQGLREPSGFRYVAEQQQSR